MFHELWEGIEAIKSIAQSLRELVRLEKKEVEGQQFAVGFKISQTIGGIMQSDIKGIVKGASGHFVSTTVPVGGQLQSGNVPKWGSSDTRVTLVVSADGFSVDATVPADDTSASFVLTESGVSSNGVPISSFVDVPLLAATPGPATGFNIVQTS